MAPLSTLNLKSDCLSKGGVTIPDVGNSTVEEEAQGLVLGPWSAGFYTVQCYDLDWHCPPEPALMMVLFRVSLAHYGSHMWLLECDGARMLNFYFLSFSTN